MRKLALLITAVLAVAAAPGSALAATKSVSILKTGFSPSSVTITQNDTVRWTNKDTVDHQVVSDRGAFVSPILKPGKTYSFTFKAGGTYHYHDGLKPTDKGTVVVKGLPPAVTIGVSAPIIFAGTAIHLNGIVSSGKTGESVTLFAQPYPQASFQQLAVVTTTTGGAYDFITTPTILTTYQATFKSATSQPATVGIKPKVTFVPGRNGYYKTTVTAAKSFAGRFVYLQRLNSFGQWVSIRKLTLGSSSGRFFKLPVRTGVSRYRIFLTVNQAGSGYLGSWSGTQTTRRR